MIGLFKNLTDYSIEYLKKYLKKNIDVVTNITDTEFPKVTEISKANQDRKLTLKEKYNKIWLLKIENKSQTEICHEVNIDIRSYKKLITASNEERAKMFLTSVDIKHESRILNKMKIVNKVRD